MHDTYQDCDNDDDRDNDDNDEMIVMITMLMTMVVMMMMRMMMTTMLSAFVFAVLRSEDDADGSFFAACCDGVEVRVMIMKMM
jgi:hypothetical protein